MSLASLLISCVALFGTPSVAGAVSNGSSIDCLKSGNVGDPVWANGPRQARSQAGTNGFGANQSCILIAAGLTYFFAGTVYTEASSSYTYVPAQQQSIQINRYGNAYSGRVYWTNIPGQTWPYYVQASCPAPLNTYCP